MPKDEGPVRVGLSMHIVNKETSEIEERPVAVRLPKWIWGILQARANYCHQGKLNEAFAEIMGLGLQYLGEKVTVDETEIPSNPKEWN
jgi:hypothetical protein